jgi:phasin
MTETTAGRARPAKPFPSAGSSFARPMTDGGDAVREFAQQGAAYSKDIYEKTKATAEETYKVLEQTYATVTKGAVDFNLQWLEMARHNINVTFDLAAQLAGAKSPSEFFELSATHARKQVETFSKQAQHLTALAQKVTTEAVQPLQAGVTGGFNKAA